MQLTKINNTLIDTRQLLEVLKEVNFSLNGSHFEFDSNGNPNIGYNILQWVWGNNILSFKDVGTFYENLSINNTLIQWHTVCAKVISARISSSNIMLHFIGFSHFSPLGLNISMCQLRSAKWFSLTPPLLQAPESTCSSECGPGQVRRVKGFHSCCYDCIDCLPGTFQNGTSG